MIQDKKEIINILKNGGVGVLPTDTIYGLVGLALRKKAVEKIYKLKKRGKLKPFIILIGGVDDLELFGVELNSQVEKVLKQVWPGSVSVILRCPKLKKSLSYLQPLKRTLAFRCPKDKWLNNLLKETGPLVAPSANIEGLPPAEDIKQAKKYFNDKIDFYSDEGTIKSAPSAIIALQNGQIKILRQGKTKIKAMFNSCDRRN